VGEVAEPERHPFHPLDEVVGGLGGAVGDAGSVPGRDLGAPAHDGAAELADLGWAVVVLEVGAEPVDELRSEVRVVDVVDAPDGLPRMPCGADCWARSPSTTPTSSW
jgi:hypothetical protein